MSTTLSMSQSGSYDTSTHTPEAGTLALARMQQEVWTCCAILGASQLQCMLKPWVEASATSATRTRHVISLPAHVRATRCIL